MSNIQIPDWLAAKREQRIRQWAKMSTTERAVYDQAIRDVLESSTVPKLRRPHPDEALWKDKFEKLVQFMADAEHDIRREGFDRCDDRGWDAAPQIYVSFGLDVCDSFAHAVKAFGEGKFDRYALIETGDNPQEDPNADRKWNAGDLLGWTKAQLAEMECRQGEDCDHCVGAAIVADLESRP